MTPEMRNIIDNSRVVVSVPGREPRYGRRCGHYKNWVSVTLDGRRTIDWFWHEYVTTTPKEA